MDFGYRDSEGLPLFSRPQKARIAEGDVCAKGVLSLVTAALVLYAVCRATYAQSDSVVVFNEIMYHPGGYEARLEWVELCNEMAVDVDLTGWSLQGGIQYDFPPGTIMPAGAYLVIAGSPVDLAGATGYSSALGPFTGRLSNGGEELRLLNNNQRLMSRVAYDDAYPWPAARAEEIDLTVFGDSLRPGENVLALHGLNRSASDADFLLVAALQARRVAVDANVPTVAFHEIAPSGSAPFWIELYNHGIQAADLTGLVIGSSRGSEYVLPGVLLESGQYYTANALGNGTKGGTSSFSTAPAAGWSWMPSRWRRNCKVAPSPTRSAGCGSRTGLPPAAPMLSPLTTKS